jgi:hypothetical protein
MEIKNSGLFLLLAIGITAPFPARAQEPGQPPPPFPNNGRPRNNPNGPWNNDVLVYRVSASGTVEKAATFERAGVPTIARLKDGRLIAAHQHFPENDAANFDKVAVHFSSDEGKTWTAPGVIRVDGLPEGMRFPFDPTLVPLPDGRVRLYFTGNYHLPRQRTIPNICSAISTDGIHYTFEPGVRFQVEERMTIDCAVVLHQGTFHLFVPDNGSPPELGVGVRPHEGYGYHAVSKDGLKFTRMDDVQIEGRRHWLGNAQSDGKQITFYGTGEGYSVEGRPQGGMWMATSADGKAWKLTPNPSVFGGDPGAVKTRDGGLLIVITGPPVRRAPGPPPPPERRGEDRPFKLEQGANKP